MALNRTKVVQEAEKFVARGKVAAAIKEYRRLLAENPDDVTTLNRVGDLYVQNGESDEALRLFWEVAERYTRDGFHTRAIAILKKVIRTDPTRLDAYERLAELYAHERLTKEAIQQYQVLVDYHAKHGSPAAAAKILQKMVEVQPEDPSILLHLAEMLERQGLPERALPEYRKLADLMLRHGKPQEAQQVYARALELAPEDLAFVTDMVLGLKEAGHTGVAARLLSRAVELNPQAARIAEMARQPRPAPPPEAAPAAVARAVPAAAPRPAAAEPVAAPAAPAPPRHPPERRSRSTSRWRSRRPRRGRCGPPWPPRPHRQRRRSRSSTSRSRSSRRRSRARPAPRGRGPPRWRRCRPPLRRRTSRTGSNGISKRAPSTSTCPTWRR
ncbi:MAG: tetratricopeptide repeat protein [Thermoanaerobaculia bacterium]|nr:tetratricopeptide repeat protein [Thermoanaerobaculia bacterium]